jgi:peptidoglycan/xylan/chitin deacetylase (PgdA/CDA1 family)
MYHRVAVSRCDPWRLAVDPHRFDEQIAYLAKHRTPLSMGDFVHHLADHTLPADAVAITFDDGYRDNLRNAAPILRRYHVPATVFLATGYVGHPHPFWWDELASIVLTWPGAAHHSATLNGEAMDLSWGELAHSDTKPWHACERPRTARQIAYLALWSKLRSCSMEERGHFMHSLRLYLQPQREKANQKKSHQHQLDLPMSAEDVRALLASGLINLGAHSVTHPCLPDLAQEERVKEIVESGARCGTLAGIAAAGFAYPHGAMDASTRDDVERSGFKWACSTKNGCVDTKHFDLFDLPRIQAMNARSSTWMDPQ